MCALMTWILACDSYIFSFTVTMAQQNVIYVARFHVQILSSPIFYTILTVWIFHRKGGKKEGRTKY
jgi:hypothetical protein